MNVAIIVQIFLNDVDNLMKTQGGNDPFRGWFTDEEVEEYLKDENRISVTKGS